MTAHRRPLLAFASAAFLLPACISINAKPIPITPPDVTAQLTAQAAAHTTGSLHKSDFAIYPSRPGEAIATKPGARDSTTARRPVPIPGPGVSPPVLKEPTENTIVPTTGDPGPFPLGPARTTAVPEPPLVAAVRAFIEGKQERAIDHVMSLGKPNQDLVLSLVPVLVRGASADLASDPVAVAVLVEQLQSAAARLEPQAALRIETVAFCRAVFGFGRYEPWPKNQPYRPNDLAQLYLEVQNLVSQPATGPRGEKYQTHARAAVEVRDAHNNVVHQQNPDDGRRVPVLRFETKRFTHSPIQDFHVLYAFPVPPAPGVYTVTVEIRDAAGRRVVKSPPVEFTVAGP